MRELTEQQKRELEVLATVRVKISIFLICLKLRISQDLSAGHSPRSCNAAVTACVVSSPRLQTRFRTE